MSPHLSDRAVQNLVPNRLREVRAYCFYNQYDSVSNPDGIVAMAIAENKLMRDEITKHMNNHFQINPWVCSIAAASITIVIGLQLNDPALLLFHFLEQGLTNALFALSSISPTAKVE